MCGVWGCVGGVRCVCGVGVCGVCGGSVQCEFHLGMMHMSASVAVRLRVEC